MTKNTVNQQIIVIAYHIGRIGSSALMGLLDTYGINAGKKAYLTGPTPINPKGFFETKVQNMFLSTVYGDYYPGLLQPPPLHIAQEVGRKHYVEYHEILMSIYGSSFPIAIKSQRFLTLPFLYELKNKYDIKVIKMNRNINDQISSLKRVWKINGKQEYANNDNKTISDWITQWDGFAKSIISAYNIEVFNIYFEDLIENPIKHTKDLFCFLNMAPPHSEIISNWFEPSLVNRKVI